MDLMITVPAVIILLPLLGLIACAVLVVMGRPILFRQERAGRGGRPFTLLKFRTMTDAADAAGRPLSDEARLTRLGRFLRATSLDELPELINVLLGEMSLVGPRPLLIEYLPLYSDAQARRHDVRPGITGWAQIQGRNLLDWDEKFQLDVWYVDHQSAFLDLKILLRTLWVVFSREGISAPDHTTMRKFTGNRNSRA